MEYYYHDFSINHEVSNFVTRTKRTKGKDYLISSNQSLDTFYFVTKLRYCLEMINLNQNSTKEYAIPDLQKIEQLAASEGAFKVPLVQIYWRLICYMKTPNEEEYINLKMIIAKYYETMEEGDQFDVLAFMLNVTFRRFANSGDIEILKEVLDLYKFGLTKDVWLENGMFPTLAFNNILFLGCRLKVYDWLNAFIKENIPKIHPELRENTHDFSKGVLAYYQKQYDRTIEFLRGVEFDKLFLLTAKSILLRCYFELSDFNLYFYDYCKAYEQFLRRTKEYPVKLYTTILHFYKLLEKCTAPG